MYAIKKEQLSCLLLSLSSLSDLYAHGSMDFSMRSCEWLKESEQAMAKLRIPEGAKMATLRTRILAAPDCALKNSGLRLRSEARKYQDATASEALEEAQVTIQNVLDEAKETLSFYEKKLEEALTAAMLVNIIPPLSHPREMWLKLILDALEAHQSTKPTIIYLKMSLISVDRLYILDSIMDKFSSS